MKTGAKCGVRSAECGVRDAKCNKPQRFVPLFERYELIRQADFRARARLATQNFEGLTL